MNVDYSDGRRELLTGLTPDQAANHVKRVTEDPAFDTATIFKERENRHERRKQAAIDRKKKGKK